MKIAQVTGFFMPKNYGSNELFLCRELSKRGHDVTVFTTAQPRQEYAMLKENSIEKSIEHYEEFTIKRFPSRLRIRDIQIMPELFESLIAENFDIIHAHEFFSPSALYGSIVKVMRHTPFVITQHNDQFPCSFINRSLYYADACTIGRLTLGQAKKIIALTRAIQGHLSLFGVPSNKIQVIPNAIDTNKFTPNNKNLLKDRWNISSPVILYVGRFSEVKGLKYLLNAFPIVLKAIPEAKLVLLGGGPLQTEVGIYEKRFPSSIISLPFVPNEVMPNVYPGCDVVVLPSLEERFGNVTLEAMACGKPVVGSCIGGMLDTIVHEETGLQVQPRNSQQIADALIRILKNEKFKIKLGQNARQKALNEFSSYAVMDKIEHLYLGALS
jgi:glycosyltransferase involved in cell wall biosynthesis